MATMIQQVKRGVEEQLELKPTTFEWLKEGYSFLGWDTNPNATTPTYSDGARGTFLADNTILYAIWQQYYTIVGAFGLCTYINGYSSEKMGATQRVAAASISNINWQDSEDTSTLAITSVGWSGGKFIRTVYTPSGQRKPQYSTDGKNWVDSDTKLYKMTHCCGGMYGNAPRYIIVCDPVSSESSGNHVGPWWSNDAITWTRSEYLNSLGSLGDYASLDKFEDCCYGRISVSGEEKDVFLV